MIDLLVAGAGPAGLSAAIAAAQRGLAVVVVDPHEGVIDKACGEGLMPAVLDALHALDVDPPGRPFGGIRYLRGGAVAEGRFDRPARGVRRTVLHGALAERAAAVGVRRVVGRVGAVRQDADAVSAAGLRARWLIGADGLRSTVRRAAGLDRPVRRPPRYGLRRHFAVRPWSDTVDVHWADDAEAYVTPVADDVVGIALLYGEAARRADAGRRDRPFDRLLDRFPSIREIAVNPIDTARGAGPFAVRSRGRVAGRILLLGDAAGYVDPITGEGTKLGIVGAIAAVDAIVAGRPEAWERAWRRLWRPYALGTEGLLALTAVPPLRAALPGLLQRTPRLFDAALRVLAG